MVHANISHTWLLTWSNPYPSESYLYSELTYLVNISNENDPTDVSACPAGFLHRLLGLKWVEAWGLGWEMRRMAPRPDSKPWRARLPHAHPAAVFLWLSGLRT